MSWLSSIDPTMKAGDWLVNVLKSGQKTPALLMRNIRHVSCEKEFDRVSIKWIEVAAEIMTLQAT
ncbi:MAG: hypothetical protein AAF456_06370 [Planctomycetota bacterium]